MKVLATLIAAALAVSPVFAGERGQRVPPTIAIIIDDMGHNLVEGKRLIALDQPITLAFLPYRRHTTELAEQAHLEQKEIMLHAPMANTRNIGLGPGGLSPGMSKNSMATTLRRALQSIPHVRGVNNHMGSLLTQQLEAMDWVMAELEHYPVYFVDSRTIASSIAGEVAAAYRIPTLTRDVFLDHEQTEEYIDRQFRLLIKRAKENGSAVGIGHPHRVTVDYLEKRLPELDEEGIAIATISGVWAMRNGNRRMFAEGEKRAIRPALAKQE
ncbi:divergent polysaccharide deacetylase family protein [Marinobacter sp. TBZ242]|uniref:Divergent polysaccharide deacetylase family protein n=1 Tax=Marinobacter azerbaijanicus TaxID=3050455 RepID=A0ABT7IBL3_9GAMM|nr:divergent polysaccharide deacetylase family protein [Marinobacter sp. TBZ242]MDL0431540.1 divergent polysaccharide deacetylase family protein [Marinobacter sp. TBZ242]